MGRNAKEEAIVKLRAALDATDDPKLIAQLTRQLTKLIPRPKQKMGRPRNAPSQVEVSPESTFKASDHPRFNQGAHLATLPMGKREFWRLVFGIEATPGYRAMTLEEKGAVSDKMVSGFSDAERAALAAYEQSDDELMLIYGRGERLSRA